ncbi:unnamed protein product [Caretta caretta]
MTNVFGIGFLIRKTSGWSCVCKLITSPLKAAPFPYTLEKHTKKCLSGGTLKRHGGRKGKERLTLLLFLCIDYYAEPHNTREERGWEQTALQLAYGRRKSAAWTSFFKYCHLDI